MVPPPPDPVMQAIIDQSFRPVDVTLGGDPNSQSVLCAKHQLEKCVDCDLDFKELNRLSKILFMNPNLLCPPPAKIVNQKLSQMVNVTKDEGNVRRVTCFRHRR
jgi:translocation protein SEC72